MTTIKEVYRVNLFPNPRMRQTGAQPIDIQQAGFEWVNDGGIALISKESNGEVIGGYFRFEVEVEPNTDYVLDCSLEWQAGTVNGRGATVSVSDSSNTLLAQTAAGKNGVDDLPLRFRSPAEDRVRVHFRAPSELDGRLIIRNVQLEPAATYDAAVSGGGGLRSSAETRTRSHRRFYRAGDAR